MGLFDPIIIYGSGIVSKLIFQKFFKSLEEIVLFIFFFKKLMILLG